MSSLPPALIRSGRIELWLEMKLPDVDARRAILAACVEGMPGRDGELDLGAIAAATDGFTGADLGRLVDDAKALVLADLVASHSIDDLTGVFLAAVEEVRRNMNIIRAAAARAEARPTERPGERIYGIPSQGEDAPPSS